MPVTETPLLPFVDGLVWVKRIRLRFPWRWFGAQMGSRMTVMRLADGGLLVHSPVALDAELRAAVDALGPVRFVVAPNRLHHLYVADWVAGYPEAAFWCAPALETKRADVPWTGVLGDAPAPGWAADIDQAALQGNRFMTEILFCHRAARTLVVTDALESFHRADHGPAACALARVGGVWERAGYTRDQRLMIKNRAAFRRSIEKVLGWDFDRIVLAHGHLVEADGKRVFREAFGWLLG